MACMKEKKCDLKILDYNGYPDQREERTFSITGLDDHRYADSERAIERVEGWRARKNI